MAHKCPSKYWREDGEDIITRALGNVQVSADVKTVKILSPELKEMGK